MKEFITYLNFDGNCRQAMEFYAKCLGVDLQVTPYSEGPAEMFKEAKDATRVLHSRLSKGAQVLLMASDGGPGRPLHQGNNFAISINCESREEVDRLFSSISEKGQVRMQPQDMFWGAYFGMTTDQFGINWMLNYEAPKQS